MSEGNQSRKPTCFSCGYLTNGINHVMRFYHPTFLDVPREWLGEQLFKVAENLRNLNEEAYRNAYLGWLNGSPTH